MEQLFKKHYYVKFIPHYLYKRMLFLSRRFTNPMFFLRCFTSSPSQRFGKKMAKEAVRELLPLFSSEVINAGREGDVGNVDFCMFVIWTSWNKISCVNNSYSSWILQNISKFASQLRSTLSLYFWFSKELSQKQVIIC